MPRVQEIVERFSGDLTAVKAGQYDGWLQASAREALAGVLLMDQLARCGPLPHYVGERARGFPVQDFGQGGRLGARGQGSENLTHSAHRTAQTQCQARQIPRCRRPKRTAVPQQQIRNAYRGSAEMYALDPKCLSWAKQLAVSAEGARGAAPPRTLAKFATSHVGCTHVLGGLQKRNGAQRRLNAFWGNNRVNINAASRTWATRVLCPVVPAGVVAGRVTVLRRTPLGWNAAHAF